LSLVSGDIKFVRVFAGVPYKGDFKRQWGPHSRVVRTWSCIFDIFCFQTERQTDGFPMT